MTSHDQSNADERLSRNRDPESRNANERDETTSACAGCDEPLPDDRPARQIGLEIEDRTRSTKGFMGDETNLKRIYLHRDLCGRCWDGWYDRLTPDSHGRSSVSKHP